MANRKFLNLLILVSMLASLLVMGGVSPVGATISQDPTAAANRSVSALPISPTDESKVPHYFGPYPNWANSPLTSPDVAVEILGDGTGATATATVGVNGTITGITITNPGSGYTAATVNITGGGAGATADAVVTASGVVVAVDVVAFGAGYTAPVVTISGGGAVTDATATAYGGVDAVALVSAGSGYHRPTVDFDAPDGPNGTQARGHAVCLETDCAPTVDGGTVTITDIVVDHAGSGYSTAPKVVIRDGTIPDPVRNGPGTGAEATATLAVSEVSLDTFGSGYTGVPTVTIADSNGGTGSGATATATVSAGGVTSITNLVGGSGYLTAGGIKKFTDPLPALCVPPACPSYVTDPTAKYIPVAVPEEKTYNGVKADEYVIGLVQYRTSFSSSLPPTLVRGYIQLETPANAGISQHFPVTNELMDGTTVPVMQSDGVTQWLAVTPPQWLGPTIIASKDKPVRIVFYNLLPAGSDGDLFLPTDTTLMGSGMGPTGVEPTDLGTVMDGVRNPVCTENPQDPTCFKQNRATLHLHGGISPWISDGTPHQWITPAGEGTTWPEGVSVESVPDMDVCKATDDGCMTFYYTNQQSARLMFYHDHAWGITRLNVYAGEAAGYLITDPTEQKLFGTVNNVAGPFVDLGEGTPLIVQDRTFVPDPAQLALQDPTWDAARWGGKGSFWYHHVYMPAQNPGDPGGMSAYGRWMYGPWFWPPATPPYGPIANPYYDPTCNLNDPATWTYQTDPFCEPPQIPGTPNISVGMEQFNDTPIVNGTAYPTITLDPKAYRLRILNAANDRFFNFQWYVGDTATADPVLGPTEVALDPTLVAAAQLDPVVFPTPVDANNNAAGPDWVVIGSEGGFLPEPVVVDGQQPTTWITDPTVFNVGNVDQHSLLLAPAERADVIVDFSQFAGQTLILYNDAPAAFPARVPSYDYYTGYPDQWPNGPSAILPGYGPNTRTVMQVKINGTTPDPNAAFDKPNTTIDRMGQLRAAFLHKADGSGVFESGQHPIIVGQAAYNKAYGTSFAAAGDCTLPGSTIKCDGMARINQQGGMPFTFDTLRMNANGSYPTGFGKVVLPIEPKAIHDEMNSAAFDEFGRMTANLGLEVVPATPALQNIVLYPYVNPATELIDATNLPKNSVILDANGLPVGDVKITPIATQDGSQIWKITHNGVDTHPIHFHLYDVQVLNRVTWDNIVSPPHPTELGWKDTLRISPLEDTIVALRPIIPQMPWELPNAVRLLNPFRPEGSTFGFNSVDAAGNPTAAITNDLVNFGWEYVFHCHILSHEEMDMMRPVSVAMPPKMPGTPTFSVPAQGPKNLTLTWMDNSISETHFVVQRDDGTGWVDVATIAQPLYQAPGDPTQVGLNRTWVDTNYNQNRAYSYRVVAQNQVGYFGAGGAFKTMTVQSTTPALYVGPTIPIPAAPTNLTATLQVGPRVSLTWRDNASNEDGFYVERSTDGVNFTQIATAPARGGTGNVTFIDTTITAGATQTIFTYRVAAFNLGGASAYSNTASVTLLPAPAAPGNLRAVNGPNGGGNSRTVNLTWQDLSNNETGFTIQRSTTSAFSANVVTTNVGPNVQANQQTGLARNTTYFFRIRANNGAFASSAWTPVPPLLVQVTTNP